MDQKQQEEAEEQAERFESIPWASLVPDKNPNVRRYLTAVVTVVAGILLGIVGGRLLRGDTGRSVVVPPPGAAAVAETVPPVAVSPVATDPPATVAVVEPTSASVPAPPRLYSEADLMAVMPEEEIRAAVMRAEWFVTDFFTVDGEAGAAGGVLAALPPGRAGPALPHRGGGGISYVEWARAYLVEPLGPGSYRVEIAFRTLAGPGPGDLVREPVRAVALEIHVGIDGATAVADYPSPVALPPVHTVAVAETAESEAPPDVIGTALTAAAAIGTDPEVLQSGLDDEGWRVVVMAGDSSGLRWPFVIRP